MPLRLPLGITIRSCFTKFEEYASGGDVECIFMRMIEDNTKYLDGYAGGLARK